MKQLVKAGFFDGCRFFRVVPGMLIQFGINGNPNVTTEWKSKRFLDDPVYQANIRGWLSFANSAEKNSRNTQIFINTADNLKLDNMGIAPFAQVVSGMDVVNQIYEGYGDAGQGDGKDGKDFAN